jgi:hypothetical protein
MIVALRCIHESCSRPANGHPLLGFAFPHPSRRISNLRATAARKSNSARRRPSFERLSAHRCPATHFGPPIYSAPRRKSPHLFVLGTAVYTAALLDMAETSSRLPNFHEYDPLARPLLKLPAPLYYTAGMSWATGINLVGWKMARAPRMRRFWWTAQAAAIMGHLTGFGYTRTH